MRVWLQRRRQLIDTEVSAILLNAGGVLVFPEPANLLPPLRQAGADPDLTTLERAHYHAMAAQDRQATPPAPGHLVARLPDDLRRRLRRGRGQVRAARHRDRRAPRRYGWAHAGHGVKDGLRALAGLGLPMGVVSNSNGTVEGDLRNVGLCYVPDGDGPSPDGIEMGVILDSAVVGVAKPDPGIFRIALDALNVPADGQRPARGGQPALRRGRGDRRGLQPVHMDPYGLCPRPAGTST